MKIRLTQYAIHHLAAMLRTVNDTHPQPIRELAEGMLPALEALAGYGRDAFDAEFATYIDAERDVLMLMAAMTHAYAEFVREQIIRNESTADRYVRGMQAAARIRAVGLDVHNAIVAADCIPETAQHTLRAAELAKVLRISSQLHAAREPDCDGSCPREQDRRRIVCLLEAPGPLTLLDDRDLASIVLDCATVLGAALDPSEDIPMSAGQIVLIFEDVRRMHLNMMSAVLDADT